MPRAVLSSFAMTRGAILLLLVKSTWRDFFYLLIRRRLFLVIMAFSGSYDAFGLFFFFFLHELDV